MILSYVRADTYSSSQFTSAPKLESKHLMFTSSSVTKLLTILHNLRSENETKNVNYCIKSKYYHTTTPRVISFSVSMDNNT